MIPRAQRAAKFMAAMGLWRPPLGPGAPGPLPASTCPSCMKCECNELRVIWPVPHEILSVITRSTIIT